MIHFHFAIRNPWSERFQNICCWHGLITQHKAWEVEILRTTDWLGMNFSLSHRCDHAGIDLEISLFTYNISFQIYDTRHWDYDKKCYTTDVVGYNGSDFY